MQIPEEFGNYLLLKKLAEDPLGESFRAGRLGKEGVEQVVLLRVFNGKGMDGDKLWQRVSGNAAVQQALHSPNIGSGVDLGRVRNFPYTSYDYISGKSLATLLAQASRQGSPIPADHALLIAERVSLALAVAYESRVQDERILHGFVVPHLVMVSNEGETRLLGFEAAPGLRELAAGGWRDGELLPYLAPEALSAAAVTRADDVWSLGALLYELLTGDRLPVAGPEGLGAVVDAAVVAYDGTALSAPVAALLKKSLVARDQRIADAVTWHKALSKLMLEGQYSPTTFNLAFFMHNLFRDEIEREGQEMQAEKKLSVVPRGLGATTQELPVKGAANRGAPAAGAALGTAAAAAATAAGTPAAALGDRLEKTGVREVTLPGVRPQGAQSAAGPSKPLVLGLAALVVLGLAAAVYYFFFRAPAPLPAGPPMGSEAAMLPTQPAEGALGTQPGALPAATEPTAAAPSPEQIQSQIAAMFDARSKEMEAKLKGQYDDRIKELQKQLEDSRRAGTAPASASGPARAAEAEPKADTRTVEPAASPSAPASAPAPAPATQPAVVPPASAPANPAPASPSDDAPARPPAAPAPAPQVQRGDLVQPGPGVVYPQLSGLPEPRYPVAARRMKKSALIDLKVLVDERGHVIESQQVGPKVGFGFDEAAMDAAKRANFRPASKGGVPVKMWATLRVSFKPQS